jgi:hypothetical protein
MPSMRRRFPVVIFLVLAAACDEPIETRRVPKEGASMAVEPSARPKGLRWSVPAGWRERAGTGMRAATFELPVERGRAEATVVALPGDVGGELANVNRWRGQIALPPLTPNQLAGARAELRAPAGRVSVYDFSSGADPVQRLVAGMVKVRGTTWFFKLMGESRAVGAHKPVFLKLLEGLRNDES